MIKIKLSPNSFYKKLNKHLEKGNDILEKQISEPKLLEKEMNEWEKNAVDFLKNNTVDLPEQLITNVEHTVTEDWFTFGLLKKDFDKNPESHIEYLTKHLKKKIKAFEVTLDYLSISEIIKGKEKPELFTIQEKITFVLKKLYELYNDNFYSISMIFEINEIDYRENEPNEIAENLKKRGYGIRETDYTTKDLLKISVKGAAYVERQNKKQKNKEKKTKDAKVNEKIDLVIAKLEKLGYGQKIIFDEIEELRGLSKKLNKKTWSQVIKGKVMDLALSELISKDTASFIYESLVEDKFKLLK